MGLIINSRRCDLYRFGVNRRDLCYRVDSKSGVSTAYPGRYSCLSAILRRFLGWSYRMWDGQRMIVVAERATAFRPMRQKRYGRGR